MLMTENDTATLQFNIIDTGIGIPEEKMDCIFDVFTQGDTDTTRKYGGTGLGLAICKHLVGLQMGTLTVKSELGKGSTFIVEIPFDLLQDEKHAEAEDESVFIKDLKILLTEDNEFNVMVARDVLESTIPGVHIDVAENGEIAVAKVNSGHYDLILMDIQMPEMDGYDATKAIRQMNGSRTGIPIIAMTANVMKAEVDRCFEAGMNGYISKPFERSELLKQINKVLLPSSI